VTQVRERNVFARRRPAGNSSASQSEGAGDSGRIRAWWGELTGPTRVLLSVNGVVITGIALLAALLPPTP
jgi:type IV secretory pathway VirB2 component (pilin)